MSNGYSREDESDEFMAAMDADLMGDITGDPAADRELVAVGAREADDYLDSQRDWAGRAPGLSGRERPTGNGALLPDEPAPTGKDQTYFVAMTWVDYEERFGVRRPYATPRDEFCQNAHRPTMHQLLQRWQGDPLQHEIPGIYADPVMEVERDKVQDMRRRSQDISHAVDPDYLARENYWDIKRLQARIDELNTLLDNGVEKVPERVGNPTDGYKTVEVMRVITPETRVRYALTINTLTKTKAVLRGQASEIFEHRHEAIGGLGVMLDEALRRNNAVDRDGVSISDLERAADGLLNRLPGDAAVPVEPVESKPQTGGKALPPGRLFEGGPLLAPNDPVSVPRNGSAGNGSNGNGSNGGGY